MLVAPSGKVAYADVARGSKAEYTSRSFFPANVATACPGMFLATLSKRCAAMSGSPHTHFRPEDSNERANNEKENI